MSCKNMESRILAYVDERLKESERAEMEKHLASCAACGVQVNEFRAVNDLLGELPMVEPSPAFDVRVRARVAAEPVKQKATWWSWAWPAPRVAFAATALLGAILWIGYRSETVTPPIPPQIADAEMMQDLSVIEDHETLSNFEPLKELPPPVDNSNQDDDQQQM